MNQFYISCFGAKVPQFDVSDTKSFAMMNILGAFPLLDSSAHGEKSFNDALMLSP